METTARNRRLGQGRQSHCARPSLGMAYGAGAVQVLKGGGNGLMMSCAPPDMKSVPLADAGQQEGEPCHPTASSCELACRSAYTRDWLVICSIPDLQPKEKLNMNELDIYERLADALDALPAGFTRTPSKSEIKLLKLVFTPEEALIAGTLSRKLETAGEIAQRVGMPEEKVTVLLEGMIPRRMVRADTLALESGFKDLGKSRQSRRRTKAQSVKTYRLQQFLVGWYESYLQEVKPDSTEFARIYAAVLIEGGGEKIFAPRPGPQGVIPYRGFAQAGVAQAGTLQRRRCPLSETRPLPGT